MIEVILLSIFIVSVAGAGAILARRMPVAQRMAALPGAAEVVNLGQAAKKLCVAGIKKVPCFRDFNWLDFVQKMLMKGRVFVLRAENKINDYMIKLRQKAEAERIKEGEALDNYWHDLKTMVKTKNLIRNAETKSGQEKRIAVDIKEMEPDNLDVRSAIAQAQSQIEAVQPAITRVVIPENSEKSESQHHKKKRNSKKRKFKDPFQW